MTSNFKAKLLGSIALLSLSGVGALAQEAQEVKFTLLVASDLYEMAVDEERGGFARAAAVARDVKSNAENVIYAFPGDTISPSLTSRLTSSTALTPPKLMVRFLIEKNAIIDLLSLNPRGGTFSTSSLF